MALVTVEGIDGSGKTTLAKEIAEEFRRLGETVTELHFGPPVYDHGSTMTYGEQAIAELEEPLEGYVPASGYTFVLDRAHWGCPAYGPVFRPSLDQRQGFGELTGPEFWSFHDWLNSMGALQIYVDVPVDVALDRTSAARDQLFTDDRERRRTQLHQVQANYSELMSKILIHGGPPVEWIQLTEPSSSKDMAPRLVGKAADRAFLAATTANLEAKLR